MLLAADARGVLCVHLHALADRLIGLHSPVNDLEKIVALAAAGPVVRMLRDGGVSFEEIAVKCKKTANPLGLSARQLYRIYEGPERYDWDCLRKVVRKLPRS